MAHLYDEEPGSRQATEEIKTTRFRPRYRQLTEDERGLHDEIKSKADELAVLFDRVPPAATMHSPLPRSRSLSCG